jgi:hypothetical protein
MSTGEAPEPGNYCVVSAFSFSDIIAEPESGTGHGCSSTEHEE